MSRKIMGSVIQTLDPGPQTSDWKAKITGGKGGRCEKIGLGPFLVIPAKAGIQCFRSLVNFLDPLAYRRQGFSPR